jgi:glycosyltransferase involved in cell wall biosynthesis
MIKVIFIPYFRGNPYQKELANSLLKQGVEVSFGIGFRLFSVLSLVKNHCNTNILHLHWPYLFLMPKNRGKTILKSIIFISELLILKQFGTKIVWTVHNILSHEGKFSSIELFFKKLLARLCDKIIAHYPYAKSEIQRIYGIKDSSIVIIPHGNYIQCYENTINRTQARKRLKINTDLVFLYFGSIKPYKGVLDLINVFKGLPQWQTKLLIVGQPLNDEIADKIREGCSLYKNIKLIFGFIPEHEVQIYMNAADIVVLPYRDILTSGAVILAISFGKPVIAPSIGCIPDILDREGSFLYDPLERNSLLKTMKLVLKTNVDDLRRMGEHNFELAKQFNWDDIAKRTCNVYKECLGRKLEINNSKLIF